jgi:hypothetical protein
VIGKNVPENRNSGIMKNRKIMVNEVSLVRVTAHASMGSRSQPGEHRHRQRRDHPRGGTAPNAAATARKIAQFMASRNVTNSTWPWKMSAGRSGEATAAW